MEEWENHTHLTGGHCFEMLFLNVGRIRRFRIVGNIGGERVAIDCETGERFNFSLHTSLKQEYFTLREIDCNNCLQ